MKNLTLTLFFFASLGLSSVYAQHTGGGGGTGPDLDARTAQDFMDFVEFRNNYIQIDLEDIHELTLDGEVYDLYDLKYRKIEDVSIDGDIITIPRSKNHEILLRNGKQFSNLAITNKGRALNSFRERLEHQERFEKIQALLRKLPE